jgi:hypothetical protein
MDAAWWARFLTGCGILLAKFYASSFSGLFGAFVPVASGFQALVDRVSGKVKFKREPNTSDAALDTRRERLRRRNARLWWAQVAVAIVSFAINLWLVIDEIPKLGTPPIAAPSLIQSIGLIVLMVLTIAAIALMLARAKTTLGLDRLN